MTQKNQIKVLVGIPIHLTQEIPDHLKKDLKNLKGEFEILYMRDREDEAFKGERIWRIAVARDRIVDEALARDCTHLLFIDSDVSFPPETLEVLLSVDGDIVSHNYDSKIKRERIIQGMGCTLIRRKVFERCRFQKGMKVIGNWKKGGSGSDVQFRKQAREAGFKIINLDRKLNVRHLPYGFGSLLDQWLRTKKSEK